MKRQSLSIQTLDAKRCDKSRDELVNGGGKLKVPCLRVVDAPGGKKWVHESKDTIDYLEGRFAGLLRVKGTSLQHSATTETQKRLQAELKPLQGP